MIKKFAVLAVVGVIAKLVLDRITGKRDSDLWAEATDEVR